MRAVLPLRQGGMSMAMRFGLQYEGSVESVHILK